MPPQLDTESNLESTTRGDSAVSRLSKNIEIILIGVFGLLPLIIFPSLYASFEFTKALLVVCAISAILVMYSLLVLRTGEIVIPRSFSLLFLWCIVGVSSTSALLSGDIADSFLGDSLEVHSVGFLILIALSATAWAVVGVRKESILRFYALLVTSTIVLIALHASRLFLGADTLSFGVLPQVVSSPIGGWNDFALLLGLAVLMSLVALEQLRLSSVGKWVCAGVVVSSLLLLMVIHFRIVWAVLGIVSLVLLLYHYTSERYQFFATTKKIPKLSPGGVLKEKRTFRIVIYAIVLICAFVSLQGGEALSNKVNEIFDVVYVEVRPNVEATLGIIQGTYTEHPFLGVGPNKFADAWRLYKDPVINSTVFWNTEFTAGSGYIPTFFVTTGVLGVLVWLGFVGYFAYTGVRMLTRSSFTDPVWFFILTSSFVGALYIMNLALVYTPGATLLLLGAVCTGLTVLASQKVGCGRVREFRIGDDRTSGFILTLLSVAAVIVSMVCVYVVGRMYVASVTYNELRTKEANGAPVNELEQLAVEAYELRDSDNYARKVAEYQLKRITSLIAREDPTSEEQQQFRDAITNGINAGRAATEVDPTYPENWLVLGQIYSVLSRASVEGSYEQANEAFSRAQSLDPLNPRIVLQQAVLERNVGNMDAAKALVHEAIQYKNNYKNAFSVRAEIAIEEGNIVEALRSARALQTLDPNNPARLYQLGVLELANGNISGAISVLEDAVSLDPQYANARYYLGLAYAASGDVSGATVQFEAILENNPNAKEVKEYLEQLETTGVIEATDALSAQEELGEQIPVVVDDLGDIRTEGSFDSSLITPLNTPLDSEADGVLLEQTDGTNDDTVIE